MKKTIKTPAEKPWFAGLMLKTFIGKGERAKSFSRRTCALAVWLGLMFIGTNVALLGVQSAHASTTLYDVQFNLYSQYQQTGAAIIGQAGDYWNRLAAASGTSALANTAGNMNGASFAWAGTGLLVSGIANPSFGNGDSNLMDCYIYSTNPQNMTFSNLTANAPFTLYIYTQGDSATTGRKLSVTFNGSTYTASAAVAGTTSFVSGQNYLTISGTTTASGTLPFSYTYAVGEADINGIQLSVANFAPTITTQPASQTVVAGGMVNLNVTPTGTAPFYYQWFKNGGMVLGATNSALTFSSASVTSSGVYYAVVTNVDGLSISRPATVVVGNPRLLAWGKNANGQLGDGSLNNRSLPETVAGDVILAAAGYEHSLFVKGDGTLWAMGNNSSGQLGDGTLTNKYSPESVASNVVAVAAGEYHSLFLKSDGALWAMGNNNDGQLGDGTTTNRSLPESVASNVVAMAAGANFSLFLKGDGTLWAMGYNYDGELGDGTTTYQHSPVAVLGGSNVVAVAAGSGVSLFLKSDGALWAMGYNQNGELGDGTTINRNSPVAVLGGSNVVAMAAGANHSLFLKGDGTLWAMGFNGDGQLGDGTTTEMGFPQSVTNNVVAVAAGWFHSLFLKGDGTLWAMGNNTYGQLGDGTTTQRNSPVSVPGISLANILSGSVAYHTLAVGEPLPPVIMSQPTNQTAMAGSPVTFTVTASGFEPLAYQWQFNGTNVVSATNASYSLDSVALSDTGSYAVVVTNNYGSAVSSTATLTVTNQPPSTATVTVAAAPSNAGSVAGGGVYLVGTNAMLTATASDGWKFISWNDGTTNNPALITVPDTNITYTAQFEATATITVSANPNTGGFVIGGGTFLVGSTNVISAVASNGWVFAGWSGGISNNPCTIVAISNLTLTANFVPAATVTTVALPPEGGLTAGDGTYAIGSSATVTATATNGWLFLNWNGTVTNNPWTFLVPSNATVCTANFAQVSTVTGLANPTNAGSVTGGGGYIVGSNAVLTATSSNNWQFINWNDGTTNNPYVITVPDTNITYTAQFEATATITVGASPSDSGFVTGGGTFLIGSTNLITAMASNNWVFAGWSDGTTNNLYTIVVTSNLTYTANFNPASAVTTLASPPEGGSTAGDGDYAIGSSATVTATATNGWAFLNWNGSVTNNPWTFVVPSSATVCTANFAQISTVTGLADPTNAGSVAGGGMYFVGSNAVLTATASNNWQFINWNDGTTNNPYVITVPATNITYTAQFEATATITVFANPNAGGSVTGGGTFLVGSTNLIMAVASNGWAFVRWDDGATDHSHAIVAVSNRTFTANFAAAATVTIVVYPTNAGAVVTGGGVYAVGSNAVLTALIPTSTNLNKWIFLNWDGTVRNYTKTGITNNPLEFTATANVTVTANFAKVTPDGFVYLVVPKGTSSPQGIQNRKAALADSPAYNLDEEEEIELVRYVGPEDDVVIPPDIDGIGIGRIDEGAFTDKHYHEISFPEEKDGSITAENSSMDTAILDVSAITDASEIAIGAEAAEGVTAVFVASAAGVVLIGILADIFANLDYVHVEVSPSSGGRGDGSGFYLAGTTAKLKASPHSGWRFNGWSDGTTDNPREIVVAGSKVYTANLVQQSTVTVVADPEDAGTVSGGGTFDVGTQIQITATAEEYWKFSDWDDETTNSSRSIIVPDHDVTYTANFEVEVEAEAEPLWGGSVTGGGDYPVGTPVVLVAITNTGWRFNGWFLDGFLTNSPTLMTVALPQEGLKYKAKFVQTILVTGLANPTNAGSVAGSGVYDIDDTNKTLTATASNNWVFVNWNDGATNNPYTIPPITVTNMISITYTANFAAVVSVAVSSSINPCGYRDGVTFTASVTPTNATGTVQFLTNGVAFDLETLTNGAATSLTPTSLPRGTNLITAVYSGDSLDLPGTNTLEQVVTNHPPQATPATYTLAAVPGYKILITDLATNWSDADGDLITLASVNASTNGGTVSIGGKYIYYSDTNLVGDQFTYVISDGQGGTGIGTVNLLSSNGTVNTNRTLNITGLTPNGDGSVTIHFAGIPGYTYWVQAATNVAQPQWETISTNVAGTNGLWNYTDTNAANYALRFYRTCKP